MELVETAYIQLIFDRLADAYQTLPGGTPWAEETNHILRILYEALLATDPNVLQIGHSYQRNDQRIQQLPPPASWFTIPVITAGMFFPVPSGPPSPPGILPHPGFQPPSSTGVGQTGLPVGSSLPNTPTPGQPTPPSFDFDPDDGVCLLPDYNGRPCRKKRYHGVDHDGNPSNGDN